MELDIAMIIVMRKKKNVFLNFLFFKWNKENNIEVYFD